MYIDHSQLVSNDYDGHLEKYVAKIILHLLFKTLYTRYLASITFQHGFPIFKNRNRYSNIDSIATSATSYIIY